MSWYRTGTASITNGARAVTGVLTAWASQAKAEDAISFDGGDKWYEIAAVNSNTSITLASDFDETTVSGGSYVIDRRGRAWSLTSELNATLTALLAGVTHILSGEGAPADSLGANGDVYFDTLNLDFYGQKSGGTWPAAVSLNGTDGADGADGNTVLSGTAAPTTEGVNGDFYIRTSTNYIYGPKAGGVWPAGVSMTGPAGADGADGVDGTNGTDGADGVSFAWQNAWLTATAYVVNDVVENDGSSYICTADHTSGAGTEPGTGGSWATVWDLMAAKGADGLGVGDIVGPASATNNNLAQFDGTTGKLLEDSGVAISTDGTLAGNSDALVPTQKAVKAYADALIAANDAMVFQGVVDCSANPNYPAADRGDTYRVSVAGKIGGGSGPNVQVGDILLCLTDSTASGDHATVGAQWSIIQANIDGALLTTDIGSSVQAYNALLTAIAALSMVADRMIYGTGSGTVDLATLTAAGRALLDDATAQAQRTTLGFTGDFGTLASASTADLSSVAGVCVEITGTTTITSLGSGANLLKIVRFAGVLTLTHDGTTLKLPSSINITTSAGDIAIFGSDSSGNWRCLSYMRNSGTARLVTETLVIAVSDETTAITTGTAKVTFRMPWAMTVTQVRASLSTESSSGAVTVDINEGGSSILSTKLTIDANEKTSTTAATPYVLSDTALADDAEITIDIDGAGTGAKGLKVSIRGYRND